MTDSGILEKTSYGRKKKNCFYKTHYLASTLETTPHVMSLIKEREMKKEKEIFGWKKIPRENRAQYLNSKDEKVEEHCLLLAL